MRAAGIQRLGYVPQNTALWDCAARIEFMIDPTYVFSAAWVNWMRDNIYNDPVRATAAGYWSGPDEPDENTCPTSSACYTQMAILFNYAHTEIPAIKSMVTLPASCLFNPSLWPIKCAPYYGLVRHTGNDYFPHQWMPHAPLVVGTLTASLEAQNNPGQDIVFYADGGSNGAFPGGGLVPWQTMYAEGVAIRDNGGEAYVMFDTRDAAVGTEQWRHIVEATDRLTPPPNDVDYSGTVD